MKRRSLGQVVVDAWESVVRESDRRKRDQVTTLHDWKRKANHVWVDEGWMRTRPRVGGWLSAALKDSEG